jgi:predicted secreted protein
MVWVGASHAESGGMNTSFLRFQQVVSMVSLVLGLSAAGCTGAEPLTISDSGTEQTFDVGSEFEVELGENPSTGFALSLDDSTLGVLKFVDEVFESSGDGDGSGGVSIYTFRCEASGTGQVRIMESPPGGAAQEALTIDIVCE